MRVFYDYIENIASRDVVPGTVNALRAEFRNAFMKCGEDVIVASFEKVAPINKRLKRELKMKYGNMTGGIVASKIFNRAFEEERVAFCRLENA